MDGTSAATDRANRRKIAIWLFVICGMIAAMVVIGGITRLTDSGLSIVQWNLLLGWIPPLSQAEWQQQFDLYRQTSEFHLQFPYLDLAGFKSIFWWEYIHRFWGRLIGIVAAAGMVWFLLDGRTERRMKVHSVALFVAISVQGAIGYWMVTSGFVNRDDVSQYRLTIHLGVAILIIAYALWLAIGLLSPDRDQRMPSAGVRRLSRAVVAVAFITILSGGMTAGLNAGFIHNTWPLMDGGLVPEDFSALSPFWLNFFENISTVQFDHRMMAYLTAAVVGVYWFQTRRAELHPRARMAANLLGGMVLLQIALGISTLLLVVPISLAVMHQAGAVILFSLATWNAWELSARNNPAATLRHSDATVFRKAGQPSI